MEGAEGVESAEGAEGVESAEGREARSGTPLALDYLCDVTLDFAGTELTFLSAQRALRFYCGIFTDASEEEVVSWMDVGEPTLYPEAVALRAILEDVMRAKFLGGLKHVLLNFRGSPG